MTLTREHITELRNFNEKEAAQAGKWARCSLTYEQAISLCDLALRALPLPEGETAELVKRLREHAQGRSSKHLPRENTMEWKAADTLSRQAASLATVERDMGVVRDAIVRAVPDVTTKDQDKISYGLVGAVHHLHKRAEAAEASLASARREALEEAAKIADAYADENITMAGDSVLADPVLHRARGGRLTDTEVRKSEGLIVDGTIHSSMYHAANNISAAIRALSSPRQEDTQR